jgi:hypothetical protein
MANHPKPNDDTPQAASILQRNLRGRIKETQRGEAIHFEFAFGPVRFVAIVNLPGEEEDEADVYVKINLEPSEFWRRTEGAAVRLAFGELAKFPFGPLVFEKGERTFSIGLDPTDAWRPYIRSEDKRSGEEPQRRR